ncbi:hypothetical protein MLP_50410 [Microlunatus phosphovorus NM-1]|uniref:Uncharacterized protein n=1 Tax=Microlunatus phosphovorus (strain ATCC 700054 / DSM 10555 / JCM 9379 / NBRC 101784 / NCIMB 13414 / VKM Ac-1990 / NM-1) TaxID=1032480 RepID=F5XH47_MICPN|nr:hypothetical protein MLP_50410 [Microlunatus phosphovorus NM-1]
MPCLLLDQRSHLTEPEVTAPALVCGPAAREVRRARPLNDRPWPGGANRTPRTRNWWSSVARRRETTQHPVRAAYIFGWRRQPDRRPQVSHPNPHFAPADATSHPAYVVRSDSSWCEVAIGPRRRAQDDRQSAVPGARFPPGPGATAISDRGSDGRPVRLVPVGHRRPTRRRAARATHRSGRARPQS